MKPSPKKGRGASKGGRGQNASGVIKTCEFLESPDDPYYLPSDAENAQA